MVRIRARNTEKKLQKEEEKKKMAEQMEMSRARVLESYNIKTMLWNKLEF